MAMAEGTPSPGLNFFFLVYHESINSKFTLPGPGCPRLSTTATQPWSMIYLQQ